MDQYYLSLFTNDTEKRLIDLFSMFIVFQYSEKFYFELVGMVDFFIENKDLDEQIIINAFEKMADVFYSLDIEQIDNLKLLIDGMNNGEIVLSLFKKRSKRRPPRSPYYYIALPGQCRFCGEMIVVDEKVDKRRQWHDDCKALNELIYDRSKMRQTVFHRDHGRCNFCGIIDDRIDGNWDMDHSVPLHKSKGRIETWYPNNLVTLCTSCHRKKTKMENRKD